MPSPINPGDNSYTARAAATTDNLTVTKATTATGLQASPSTGVTTATQVTLTATISSSSNSAAGPGRTIQFLYGTPQTRSAATRAAFRRVFCAPPTFRS